MTQRILIMGLPGAGKTHLAKGVFEYLQHAKKSCGWLNADNVRKQFDDWDFSIEGRLRQSIRMRTLADNMGTDYTLCDFVCPLPEMRDNLEAHYTVWVDTITEGRYEDTNKLFVPPEKYDFRITEQDAEKYAGFICEHILKESTL